MFKSKDKVLWTSARNSTFFFYTLLNDIFLYKKNII